MSTTILPRLLTPGEVARQLRMPAARVTRLARAGDIPCLWLPTGDPLFPADDLSRWLASLRRGARPGREAGHDH